MADVRRRVSKRQGVGVLGLGDIARRRFLPAVARAGATLVAIGRREPHSEAVDTSSGAVPILSYDDVLGHPKVDLVYIALPNDLHEEWACRALAAGKHVLCEKPLAPTAAAVTRMTDTANHSGRLLFENVMFLQHPQHRVVKELIANGTIGAVRLLRAVFGFSLRRNTDNFRFDLARGGGVVADLLVYPLATTELFGWSELRDPCGLLIYQDGLDVAAHATAHNGDGVVASFSVSFRQNYQSYYEIIGEAGSLRLDRAYTTPTEVANPLHVQSPTGESIVSLPAADHFAETIRHVEKLLRAPTEYGSVHADLRRRHETMERVRAALIPAYTAGESSS